jgi:DNA-binding NtrC family response regulator
MPSVIPELAGHFARTIAEEMGRPLDGLSREAVESLQSWSWPGNVRELRNVLELAVLFADGPLIGVADLPTLGPPRGGLDEDEDGELFGIPAGLTLKEAEADYIRHTLEHMDHRIQDSAAVLGISRKNLWEKRKKYGLLE